MKNQSDAKEDFEMPFRSCIRHPFSILAHLHQLAQKNFPAEAQPNILPIPL